MERFTKKINKPVFVYLIFFILPLVGLSTNYTGTWTSVTPSSGCISATGITYTLIATNPTSGGGGTANSYVAAGKTIVVTFPAGFGLAGCNSGSVNASAITSAITTTATTITFQTPVNIAKGATITIVLNNITNHATAANYQLSMLIDNATGTGTGNQNIFATGTNSQFTLNTAPTASPVSSAATAVGCTSFSANWSAVSGANSYFLDVATNSTFTSYVAGYENLNVGNVTTYSVTGLSGGTQYFYRVRSAIGLCQRTTPSATQTLTTTVCYCTSNASTTTYSYINNVTFNTINNNSTGCANYTDFTNISTTVLIGQTYTLTISKINDCTGSTPYTGRFAAWIDWNNNGDFNDPGEQVLSDAAASNGPVSASVTVPAGATIGVTRMRCIFREGSTVPPNCGSYASWGETEDYSINIQNLTTCSGTPTAGTISPANTSGNPGTVVTYTWNGIPQVGYTYQWQEAPSASGPWTNISGANGTSYTTNLINTTTYFRLLITCTNSGLSSPTNTAEVLITVGYCVHDNISCANGQQITRVILNNLDNTSGTTCTPSGYQNFTNLTSNLVIGSSYNISVYTGTGPNVTTGNPQYQHAMGVWIDFNQNGSFFDPGEFFLLGQNINPNSIVTGAIDIPPTALTGNTRMRVKYTLDNVMLSAWACINNPTPPPTYGGEVEDYTINLTCPSLPTDVTGKFPFFNAQMPCGASITLRWDNITCATGYKVYLGTNPASLSLIGTTTIGEYPTGALSPNTTYYWRVVPFNSNGDGAFSTWSFQTNTVLSTPVTNDVNICAGQPAVLTATGAAAGNVYYWYDVASGGQNIFIGNPYTVSPNPTVSDTFYVEQASISAETSIATHTTTDVWCSSGGRVGQFFDINAKTRDLIITRFEVRPTPGQTGGSVNRSYKVYYRTSPYATNMVNSSGWVYLGQFNVTTSTCPNAPCGVLANIDIPDFEIPAGATYGVYIFGAGTAWDMGLNRSAGLFQNNDLDVSVGVGTCGEFTANRYADFGFSGNVYYRTKCSSARDSVFVNVMTPAANVVLTPTTVTGLVERCTVNGWTYYSTTTTPTQWLFAINKNGNNFTATADITVGNPPNNVYENVNAPGQHGSFLMRRYWNVNITSGSINPALPVSVRFFFDTNEAEWAINRRNTVRTTSYPTTFATAWRWFKNTTGTYVPTVNVDGNIFLFANTTLTPVNNLSVLGIAPYTGWINNVAHVDLGGITSFSGGTGGVGFTPVVNGVLPIDLISFTGNEKDRYNYLTWKTASEKNNDYFIIESSQDGMNFKEIGSIKGSGISNQIVSYSFNDYDYYMPLTYYRLKQVDFDGSFTYSNVIYINRKGDVALKATVYPNPAESVITLNTTSIYKTDAKIEIVNMFGQTIISENLTLNEGSNTKTFDISSLPSGIYFIEINGLDEKAVFKFVRR